MREKLLCWGLLGLAGLISIQSLLDARHEVGKPSPGFGLMENLLVAVGGFERSGLEPLDRLRAMNGQVLTSGRQVRAEVQRHPPGTTFRYVLSRRGQLVEADVTSREWTERDFVRFGVFGFLPGLLFLGLGAVVVSLRPGTRPARLTLAFCLTWFCISGLYLNAHTTYRFYWLFLLAWSLSPAVFVHMGLTQPEPWAVARRYPWIVWPPYAVSAVLAVPLLGLVPPPPDRLLTVAAVGALDWVAALAFVVTSFVRTGLRGRTPIARSRARVLTAGLAVGLLIPVLGTGIEMVFRVTVPYLEVLWRLNVLFPLSVAYAMVRYNLFDLRSVLRAGTVYVAVTGMVVVGYAGMIAGLDLSFAHLGMRVSPLVPAVIMALAVVFLLNPVYMRMQALVDQVFFRERLDVQHSIERLADTMTTVLELDRITQLVSQTVRESFHPVRQVVVLRDEADGGYRPWTGARGGYLIAADSSLPRCLERRRVPVTRQQHEEDPEFVDCRTSCTVELESLGAEMAVPLLFRDRLTGFLALGEKRSGAAYSTQDLRLLRLLANQSAVALENARAYSALERANAELRVALRRVEILESIRSNLTKFVPATVQRLIEQAPESPEFDKRDADVSVLFVDIAGYTRLSERLEQAEVNRIVERYFGAFLDEILGHGGDVNETAGDGLMVIFQDAEPRRHARAAVLAGLGILHRARQINAELAQVEPIAFHVGVNSGTAAVGATKIEGTAGTLWTYTASGPMTNVAARLATLGAGDLMHLGQETKSRLDGEFPFEDLGEQRLRNVEEPVRAWRLVVPPWD
ncbi:MAG TPA: adenylate/guanylate cyclase domain-containing protein [Methylomirabilota bacterium]|nr:adenylate/guanylate cyclase domain-containing protein [Methylomirabilota bacterium]